jgi:cytochrome c oxidase assembly protein subunit 11
MKSPGKNTRLLLILLLCVVVMLGVAYASVPLYRLFCSATGYNGTTQRVTVAPAVQPQAVERWITVTFDSNVDQSLPWEFAPDVKSVRVKLGEVTNISYHARNKGAETTVGTATFNVQPDKVGAYFDKIQCFCFTQQVLKPGESVELPVQFYIDEALAKDHQADDVQNITLSYTFFLAKDQSKAHPVQDMNKMDMKSTPSSPATPTN